MNDKEKLELLSQLFEGILMLTDEQAEMKERVLNIEMKMNDIINNGKD